MYIIYNKQPMIMTKKEDAKYYFNMVYKDLKNIIDHYNYVVRDLPKDWINYCQDDLDKILSMFYLKNEEKENDEE